MPIIMGGPNIRLEEKGIEEFLKINKFYASIVSGVATPVLLDVVVCL